MSDVAAERVHEILSKHCAALNKLTDELRDDLLKLHKDNCTGETEECEDLFLESCLRALRAMLVMRSKSERLSNPKLN